jgi:hypothetical protein
MEREPDCHKKYATKGVTVFLVNAVDNPDARISESSFSREWSWIRAAADWKPRDGVPGNASTVDAIVVFSTKYEERSIRKLCEAIRAVPSLDPIPLLVAVNQYEMPLANRVKELPNADFLFTPLKEEDLVGRLKRLSDADSGESAD